LTYNSWLTPIPNLRLVDEIIRYPSVFKTYGLTIVVNMANVACKGFFCSLAVLSTRIVSARNKKGLASSFLTCQTVYVKHLSG
jgi:hypothetical protein